MARKGVGIDLLATVVVGNVLADCKEIPGVKGLVADSINPQILSNSLSNSIIYT